MLFLTKLGVDMYLNARTPSVVISEDIFRWLERKMSYRLFPTLYQLMQFFKLHGGKLMAQFW